MLNPRIDTLTGYPFSRLAALLDGVTPESNRPSLALSVGEPQDPAPDIVGQALAAHGHLWNRYPGTAGTPEFRSAAAGWLRRRFGLPDGLLEPDAMILPVAGTREALFLAAQLAIPPEKAGRRPAVLLPNPFYAVYEGAALMAGAEPVLLDATAETGFLPDLDALDPDLLERTALFYLCSPANPQGAAADRAYLRRALALARTYGFVLAVDECYAELYDRTPPTGVLEAVDAAEPRPLRNLLVFHSLSKRSNAAGLRSGFVVGDPELIGAFTRLRNYSLAGTPLPVLAAATALWNDDAHVEAGRARHRARLDLAEAALGGRFGFYRPQGGFFLWLDVGDGEAAAREIWRRDAIRTLPGAYVTRPSADGKNRGASYLRIALVHDLPVLEEALDRVGRTLADAAAGRL